MQLDEAKIRKNLQYDVAVRLYDSIDSTNDEAKRRAESIPVLYAASHQSAGRGRHGHSFYSPKDTGLYMTLSLPLSAVNADTQRITCAAAVAVCEAISRLSERQPFIKWVNDICIDGKKAAGILTELVTDNHNQPYAVIVGIGLNLSTNHFPAEFAQSAGNVGAIDANALCGSITNELMTLYANLEDNSIFEKYKELNLCIGRVITYERNGTVHTAKAVDVSQDGGLVVEEDGAQHTLNSGEISVKL